LSATALAARRSLAADLFMSFMLFMVNTKLPSAGPSILELLRSIESALF